jgi:hypothetical protein
LLFCKITLPGVSPKSHRDVGFGRRPFVVT